MRGREQLEVLFRVGQGVVGDQRRHVGQFGRFGAEKFAAGGSVEEEIGDGERGAARQSGVVHVEDLAAGNFDARSGALLAGGRFQRDAGHRGDGGQRLAAKAQRGDGEQVVGGAQLGGGVALEGQQGVVAVHALAVVGDADELAPARLDLDADAVGAGVQSVLQQLLHHRGRPVHHLAGGDLVGNLVGEYADAAHTLLRVTQGVSAGSVENAA